MISTITKDCIQKDRKYLLDTNIWILALSQGTEFHLDTFRGDKEVERRKRIKYLEFFDLLTHPSHENPLIIFPSVLFAEIVHAYLHKVQFRNFRKSSPKMFSAIDYKNDYRKTEQFSEDFAYLKNFLLEYEPFYDETRCDFGNKYNTKTLLEYPEERMDFNDNYYRAFAREHNYILVTDDGDFSTKNVEILTLNADLLKKATRSGGL